MMDRASIDLIIGIINSIIKLLEVLDPNLQNDWIVKDLQKIIGAVHELGF